MKERQGREIQIMMKERLSLKKWSLLGLERRRDSMMLEMFA